MLDQEWELMVLSTAQNREACAEGGHVGLQEQHPVSSAADPKQPLSVDGQPLSRVRLKGDGTQPAQSAPALPCAAPVLSPAAR